MRRKIKEHFKTNIYQKNKYKVSDKKHRTYDNKTFASKKEMERYKELKLLEGLKEISCLSLQPRFVIHDSFIDNKGVKHRNIVYVADFMYIDKFGKTIVEDVKGYKTTEYLIKIKMFLCRYPEYIFKEV